MILQALYEYYKRKENDPESGIAPEGFGYVEIPFLVHLDKEGNCTSIEDTRYQEGKKLVGRKFLVPAAVSRTVGVKANLLWDKADYALGIPDNLKITDIRKKADKIRKENSKDSEKKAEEFEKKETQKLEERTQKCFNAFVSEIQNLHFTNCISIRAIVHFLSNKPLIQMKEKIGADNNLIKVIELENPYVSFTVDGDELPICSMFKDEISKTKEQKQTENQSICLITGKKEPIARIHPLLKNVIDAQSSGAAIVSFNNPSFTSFGKKQNYNAPVSESATFAYTTALNMMLAKDSQNKMRVGDATAVFWSAKKTEFESFFSAFWGYSKDNPDADILAVKQLYNSINTGAKIPDSDTKFYVLGLSPNAARLSIRFWHTGTIAEFSNRIKQHFDDLEIVRPKNDSGHYSLFWMLSAIALEHKTENVPPNLNGEIVNAILAGTPYPTTLQHQCIRRIRAEQDVGRIRASLLKAYLNRRNRFYKSNEKELTVALDTTNENIGYRLGRLFATFEKLQEDTQPGINATIKDRYYGAASSTPCTVFPQLFKLKNHHLAKLVNVGQKVNYEKLIGEITSGIPANGMPAHLNLEDQARFAIGYYHQRQEFFKTKEDKQ